MRYPSVPMIVVIMVGVNPLLPVRITPLVKPDVHALRVGMGMIVLCLFAWTPAMVTESASTVHVLASRVMRECHVVNKYTVNSVLVVIGVLTIVMVSASLCLVWREPLVARSVMWDAQRSVSPSVSRVPMRCLLMWDCVILPSAR